MWSGRSTGQGCRDRSRNRRPSAARGTCTPSCVPVPRGRWTRTSDERSEERRASGMGTFVGLLRSINVGGRNRVPMADLRALVSSLGFDDVATYLQSGNVVFTGSGPATVVARAIQDRIASELGLEVPVIVRSKRQLEAIVRSPPFADLDVDPKTRHVTFLAAVAQPTAVEELEALAD